MNKVTDDYPGKALSTTELKQKLANEANVSLIKESKFPTEIIDLPSGGKLYPAGSALSSGKVEMKYMTAKEEDILTSANLIQKGVVIDTLLRALIISNGEGQSINYNDLVVGDKNAIMIAARVLGYGSDYPVEMVCPSCGVKQKQTVDLTTLENKKSDGDPADEDGKFTFKLPIAKKTLTFKILTHADEKLVDTEAKRMKKKKVGGNGITYELTSRFKYMIVAIDGEEDKMKIRSFVDNEFLSRDSLAFRQYAESVSPDVDMTVYFECDSCGHEDASVQMPMNVQFFWPRA
jgi:DNA-directed RNA polymerase subunit M/transcription elongation factor TFIIS